MSVPNGTTSSITIVSGGSPTSTAQSNRTTIGTTGQQTSCVIFGISGATSSGGVPVLINTSGILGTVVSSQRFKENIIDLPDSLAAILLSVPLKQFTYINDPSHEVQYGAIAETVLPLWPEVISYDEDGVTPNTIQYQKWMPVLVKIAQQQQAAITSLQAQQAKITPITCSSQANLLLGLNTFQDIVGYAMIISGGQITAIETVHSSTAGGELRLFDVTTSTILASYTITAGTITNHLWTLSGPIIIDGSAGSHYVKLQGWCAVSGVIAALQVR